MKKFIIYLLLLGGLISWDRSGWAYGPKGKPAAAKYRQLTRDKARRLRLNFESPLTKGNLRTYTPEQMKRMATMIHNFLPKRTRDATTTAVGQSGAGELLVGFSGANSPPPAIRNGVEIVRNKLQLPGMIVVPNLMGTHAEGAVESYAESFGVPIVGQGASRPLCLDCQWRHESQGIAIDPNHTTGRHAPKWNSPAQDPVRAQAEMARRATSMQYLRFVSGK